MNSDCIIYKTMDFLGKRWTTLIILELYKGKEKKKRYSEIKKRLPKITSKILSLRLKELEEHKIIIKIVSSSPIIKTEYFLTKSGMKFIPIIKKIKSWALEYKFKNKSCNEIDCEHCEF